MSQLKELLGKRTLYFDGAMGTMLIRGGFGSQPPMLLNLTNPEAIRDIHCQYIAAGSDCISANTFGAYDIEYANYDEIISAAMESALSAAREGMEKFGRKVFVALDIGSTGRLLAPHGDLSFEDCVNTYAKTIISGVKHGAELILIETMSSINEVKAAVLAAKENSDLPVFCTMTFNENGRSFTGCDLVTMTALLEGMGVDALGINCGLSPKKTAKLVDTLRGICSIPIMLQPNAGDPREDGGETVYDITPEEFGGIMAGFAGKAWILGGCCGTTPEYIAKLVTMTANIIPEPIEDKNLTIISSYNKSVVINGTDSNKPIRIGQRINPTNRPELQEALLSGDMYFLADEAAEQIESGADIIDVNVGMPGADETKLLPQVVYSLQEFVSVPLAIDSSEPEAIEAALRKYYGKPIINSTDGSADKMDSVFRMAKKYGAVIICLCIDENGIPDTAEGRVEIAERILQTAKQYGIDKKNLIFDGICLPMNLYDRSETLRTVHMLRERGLLTVLGISNISYGMENRKEINEEFMKLAVDAGVDVVIADVG